MKNIFYTAIILCAVIFVSAYTYSVIYDARYIHNTVTKDGDVVVRVVDTWEKKIYCYQHYYDEETGKWVEPWMEIQMTEKIPEK